MWLSLFILCNGHTCQPHEIEEDRRHLFTESWKFSLDAPDDAYRTDLDDSGWRTLDLPHDWSIEGNFSKDHPAGYGGGALPGGIGWYRKSFLLSEDDKGKVIYIDFDGVYQESEVYINGQLLGKRPNGYISFRYELTDYLHYDGIPNVIAVKADNSLQPNSRWYSGSGIYRNVWMVKTHPLHVDHWGTFVTTPHINTTSATIKINTTVRNSKNVTGTFTLQSALLDQDGNEVASIKNDNITIIADKNEVVQNLHITTPQLWSTSQPYLYKVVSSVYLDGNMVDRYETPIGIRYFSFDPKVGFTLNGEKMIIKGVNNHHDLGALGAAVNTRALERQLEILKGMGVNGIRTAHNPPTPELLDLCDRMGFIVMDEAFDMWSKSKSKFDYSRHWEAWHEQDLRDMMKRDRNHPSVFIWSIGNEIPEQWEDTGLLIANRLGKIAKEMDPTRPITAGLNHPYPDNSIYRSGALDLVGFNYHHEDFETFPDVFPGEKFIGAETTSALATRGHYDMPSDSIRRWPIRWDQKFIEGNQDLTVSAYDHVSAPWGSTHEETWKLIKKHDFLSGMYIWTGFDYLGEPTPYEFPARSSFFGVVDLAGFPKDSYYMYQSEWTKDTVLHVFPHWNWEVGQKVDVWAYYNNADEVELFLNEKSQGIKKKQGDELHVMWKLDFQPGTIRAVSRSAGREVKRKEIETAGRPVKIVMEADRSDLKADGKDMAFITVKVLDKDGNMVPRAENLIRFEINGNATIAATDNGDPTDLSSFQSHQRKLFNGLAMVFIKTTKVGGSVILRAHGDGLENATIELVSQ
ncbi:glycoside hydrolase [Anditalea andensis]|uniref:Glycoside hydrolase n=1 Tax=Anditalea andensis TaxID=1048983 RepID=A0A074KXX0_9BACT|nr:glycoside hydrolase [Anditalea andensis]